MKKIIITLALAVAAVFIPTAAFATGSDDATPYTVDATGITLPAGVTFPDNGHVNVKTSAGDKGIHFESLNNQPSGQWIGKDFLPWSAFGLTGCFSVTWVQISLYNEHFGEGRQSPVTVGCPTPTETSTPTPTPTETPTSTPTPTETGTPEEPTLPRMGFEPWMPFLGAGAVFAILLGSYFAWIRPKNLGRHVAK